MRAPLILPAAILTVLAAATPASAATPAASTTTASTVSTMSTAASVTLDDVSAFGAGSDGIAIAYSNGRLEYFGADGKRKWSARVGGPAGSVYVVTDGGRDWVVAHVGDSLQVFDARSSSGARAHARVPLGGRAVTATSTRLLIDGGGASPELLNPQDGSLTSVALPTGDEAAAATADGVLVTRSGVVQGVWGDRGGWSATGAAPKGAASTRPKLLSIQHGLLVLDWGRVVTVNRMLDGVTVGAGRASGSVIVASDASVVTVGSTAFDVASGSTRSLPKGVVPISAFEGVVYGTKGKGFVALDARSGHPLSPTAPTAAPSDFTNWRVGLFVEASVEKGSHSVTLTPLKALDQ